MKPLLLGLLLAASNAGAQDSACPVPPGNNVVVEGYVANPGLFPVSTSAPTLSGVIAQAGGLVFGAGRLAFILRRDENGITHEIPVRLRGAGPDIALRAGDIVTVPDAVGRRTRGCLRSRS